MTHEAQELFERAFKLPLKERASLASRLLESIGEDAGEDPAEVEKAWGEEIERRVREIDEGRASVVPHDEVMRRFRERFAPGKARPKT